MFFRDFMPLNTAASGNYGCWLVRKGRIPCRFASQVKRLVKKMLYCSRDVAGCQTCNFLKLTQAEIVLTMQQQCFRKKRVQNTLLLHI